MSIVSSIKAGYSRDQLYQNDMSLKTKHFIQKICYKKTASVDMTQFGFVNDSKLHPVNILLKPLKEQLEKICGTNNGLMVTKKTSPISCTKKSKNCKNSSKKRKVKPRDKPNREVVIRTEDLIAKRLMKRAADKANSSSYGCNKLQINK